MVCNLEYWAYINLENLEYWAYLSEKPMTVSQLHENLLQYSAPAGG